MQHRAASYPSYRVVHQQGVNLANIKCLKRVLFKSYCIVSDILPFHSLWTNVLVVSGFGRQRLLNGRQVKVSELASYGARAALLVAPVALDARQVVRVLDHAPQVGLQLRLVAVLDHRQVVQDLKGNTSQTINDNVNDNIQLYTAANKKKMGQVCAKNN